MCFLQESSRGLRRPVGGTHKSLKGGQKSTTGKENLKKGADNVRRDEDPTTKIRASLKQVPVRGTAQLTACAA